MNYVMVPGVPRQVSSKRTATFTKDSIMKAVCDVYKVKAEVLQGKKQHRIFVYPRQIAMYLMTKYTTMTLKEIGMFFNRDHTTVIHSRQLINDLLDVDRFVRDEIDLVVNRITENK